MDAESLDRIVNGIEGLRAHAEFLRGIATPSVAITLSADPATPDCSRFGGDAFLPADFIWPSHDDGEYRFLGQINFSEIAHPPASLPATGLLTLLYAFDEDGEVFWGDDGYVLGFYWEQFQDHVNTAGAEDAPPTRRIVLTPSLDVPRHGELREDWPFDEDLLYELSEHIDAGHEYLLGYPSFTSLAYDPTPGPEWMSLLTVHSLDEFDWCWHDGDKLMVFIEKDRLAKRDFSRLKSDAG